LPYSASVTLANRLLAFMNRRSGRRFDRVLAVSDPARQFAEAVYGYVNVAVLPNPVDLAQFTGAHTDNTGVNVIFLGRLVARKGALQLLQAIAYVRAQNMYNGVFHVYVGGKGELLPTLTEFVMAHGLTEYVTLCGFVEETAKPAFLAQADIAVYPSLAGESFGIVLLEAMAAARGVTLAGDNPGYASVMQPYPDQLFDPGNMQGFAELLVRYLEHPEARLQAAQSQHEYVKQFDIAVVGRQLVAVYMHILQTKALTCDTRANGAITS
jgi:phosphatidyl-myo-inositol alpha-mannosyltransferase